MRVIIDASNVADYGRTEDSKAKLDYILTAIKKLEEDKNEFIIIADASLKHEIDQKDKYKNLVEKKVIHEVEAGNNADHFILNSAEKANSKILSNDYFRDFSDEFLDINNMRISFSFEDTGEIKFGRVKKPKRVKNVLPNICTAILNEMSGKKYETYSEKDEIDFSPLNIAKESILRMDKSNQDDISSKIEGLFSKIPFFDKVVSMVEEVETSAPHIIFVLVHPKNYKEAVKNAGNISVTIGDRLKLNKNPLIAIRNDLYMKPGKFDLNIIYADEVEDEAPYDVEIRINSNDEVFIKKNSRNIASTVAGRIGSWKFPIVSVKKDIFLEKPGEFEVSLKASVKLIDKSKK
jgi:hypothetical protein